MQISGEYTFEITRERLWEALLDPKIIARTLPGSEELTAQGEHSYTTTLKVKVGPVQGNFQARFALSDLHPPESYRMKLSGRGPSGFLQGEGLIRLEEEEGSTRLIYQVEASVGGRVASVGQRLLESSAKAIARQGLEALAQQVKAMDSGAPEVAAPTQTQFAAGVAREVARDVMPRGTIWFLLLGGLGLALVLAFAFCG